MYAENYRWHILYLDFNVTRRNSTYLVRTWLCLHHSFPLSRLTPIILSTPRKGKGFRHTGGGFAIFFVDVRFHLIAPANCVQQREKEQTPEKNACHSWRRRLTNFLFGFLRIQCQIRLNGLLLFTLPSAKPKLTSYVALEVTHDRVIWNAASLWR